MITAAHCTSTPQLHDSKSAKPKSRRAEPRVDNSQWCSSRLSPKMAHPLQMKTAHVAVSRLFTGAGSRSRTRDLMITNQLLYQLSYAGFLHPFQGKSEMRRCDISWRNRPITGRNSNSGEPILFDDL
jgi:hypothetical protein